MLSHILPFTRYPYNGEHIACPVCGADTADTIATIDRRLKKLTTVLCDNCGLFFTNPMPTEVELSTYYRDMYRLDYQFAFLKPRSKHIHKKKAEAIRRYETMAQYRDLSSPLTTLDFGCGSGQIVHEFADRGHKAYGFEPGENYAAHGATQHSGNIRCGTWRDMDYDAESFDVITCLHVLEHLRDPVAALSRMAYWLKSSNGILFLETPDMQGYDFKGFEHFHFAHVLGFSSANLILAAQKAGLGVVAQLAPTSILFSKGAPAQNVGLAATVAQNRQEYGRRIHPGEYIGYHIKRLRRRSHRHAKTLHSYHKE